MKEECEKDEEESHGIIFVIQIIEICLQFLSIQIFAHLKKADIFSDELWAVNVSV